MQETDSRPFFAHYVQVLLRPRRAFDALLQDPRRSRHGACAVAITTVTYALVYYFLARNGGRPAVFTPWLAIPAEEYYRYNQYFIVPSLLLAWVAAAGFTHLSARLLGGRGTYDDTLTLLGFALSVSMWWTGLHDLVTTFLGYLRVLDQRAYEDAMNTPTPVRTMLWTLMLAYAAWFFLTFTKATAAAHRLPTPRAAVAGSVGVFVFQMVFVIFNR